MGSQRRDGNGLTEKQAFWLEHLKRCAGADFTLAAYAAKHKLSLSSLYSHRRLLRRRGLLESGPQPRPRFSRVEVVPSGPAMCRVHLPNGCTVEWQGSPDEETLRRWLAAARTLS